MKDNICLITGTEENNFRVRVLTPSVLVRELVKELKNNSVDFKRRDVVQFAEEYVAQHRGQSVPVNCYRNDIAQYIDVFNKYSQLTIMELGDMMSKISSMDDGDSNIRLA